MFRKRVPVGLDIGTCSIKCVLFNSRHLLQGMWQAPLMPERQQKNDTLPQNDTASRVSNLVKDWQKQSPDFTLTVNASISGDGTVGKYLEFPPLTSKELLVAAPAQAMRHVPYPAESVNLSFLQVPPLGDNKKSAIFFVAEQKDRAAATQSILTSAGLKVQKVEVPVLSLAREFAANHVVDKPVALVHCGFRLTHFIVIHGRHPYFYREILLAGRDFTYAFQQGAQSTWAEAENFKLNYDATEQETSIVPMMEKWLKEVKRSVSAFEAEHPDLPIEQVYLSGGSAAFKNLGRLLSEHVERPVEIDRWDEIKSDARVAGGGEPPLFKVAAGLGLEE